MIENYSNDCDYLRKRFELHNSASLYQLVREVTKYLQEQDNLKELEKLNKDTLVKTKGEQQCQEKPSKSQLKNPLKKLKKSSTLKV